MSQFAVKFPWTQKDFEKFLLRFHSGANTTVTWWWEPFHRTGFNALRYAAAHKFDENHLQRVLKDLSCVSAPTRLYKKLKTLNGIDEDGRLLSLSSERSIRQTWRVFGFHSLGDFPIDAVLPRIRDLRNYLTNNSLRFDPTLENLSEKQTVSNYLTQVPKLLKRFQRLSPWDQLELIESIEGSIISSSMLEFQHLS